MTTTNDMNPPRCDARNLTAFATSLLDRAGMDHDKSSVIADILIEGDLLDHDTQ